MSKKGILTTLALLIIAGSSFVYYTQHKVPPLKSIQQKMTVEQLHSDILKIIAESQKSVMGIKPSEAQDELVKRETKAVEVDTITADVHKLGFDVLVYISKSPTSIAGILPKQAVDEIIKRYLSIDDENISFKTMLLAAKHGDSAKSLEDWAKNEDREEIEEFIKNAKGDEKLAYAYYIKHLKDKGIEGEIVKCAQNYREDKDIWNELIAKVHEIAGKTH